MKSSTMNQIPNKIMIMNRLVGIKVIKTSRRKYLLGAEVEESGEAKSWKIINRKMIHGEKTKNPRKSKLGVRVVGVNRIAIKAIRIMENYLVGTINRKRILYRIIRGAMNQLITTVRTEKYKLK